MEAGGRQWKIAFLEGKDRCMSGRFKGRLLPAGPPQGEKTPSGGREPPQGAKRGGIFPAGPPQGEKAPSGGREPPQGGEAWGAFPPAGPPQGGKASSGGREPPQGAKRGGIFIYFGGIRMAPSRRMVSPFSMSLVMMLCTSLA